MRVIITTGLFCAAIGAVGGWWLTDDHHVAKQLKLEATQHAAETKRNEAIAQLSVEYYQLYQDAISKPPTVITERVLVKATCPVRATDSAGVDDGAPAGTAELDRGLVQDLAKLGDEKEKIYAKCYNIVNAFQGIIQKNSAGK